MIRASLKLWRARLKYRCLRLIAAQRGRDRSRIEHWKRLVDQAAHMVHRRSTQLRATRTSARGVDFIKSFEGFRSHPYQDSAKVWTIGYGHTRGVGPHSAPVSVKQATALLADELRMTYEPPVRALGLRLNQGQFDALTSLVYNLGPGILDASHTLGAALRSKRMNTAADAILLYDRAGGQRLPGLTARREAERRVFLGG